MEASALNAKRVESYLDANLEGSRGPFSFTLFGSGGSNLTYLVEDARGSRWVLRRPPTTDVLATAHDMAREWNVLQALNAMGGFPVPECLAYCSDSGVMGTEFYVMEYIPGLILRSQRDALPLTSEEARHAASSLVETQVALHNIELDGTGLLQPDRKEPYLRRQLRRWKKQVDDGSVRDVPLLHELHTFLCDTYRESSRQETLIHGDYRFDNVVLSPDFSVAAVLDWELSTVGDPVADFVWSSQYWADGGDEILWIPDAPTLAGNFPERKQIIDLYTEVSGRDLSDIDWLMVFSWWKQACISEGVHGRRAKGIRGGAASVSLSAIADRVDGVVRVAAGLADQLL